MVPPGTAESCDPNQCICTSHKNYQTILASRIAEYGLEGDDTEVIVEEETEEELENEPDEEENDSDEEVIEQRAED